MANIFRRIPNSLLKLVFAAVSASTKTKGRTSGLGKQMLSGVFDLVGHRQGAIRLQHQAEAHFIEGAENHQQARALIR